MNRKPDRTPWRKMSALRQAATLTVAFLLVLFVAGLGALAELRQEFGHRMEDELRSRFARIEAEIAAGSFDPDAYPNTEFDIVKLLENGRTGFYEQSRRGRDEDGDWDDDQWYYLGGPVAGGHLVVATNLNRRDVFEEVTLESLVLVGLLSAAAAMGIGLWFGLRNQRRISAISTVLDQVAKGDLKARVTPACDRDDLDALALRVDETTAQLDRLIRQTRDFSINIAHDLKTPLTRLRIRLETALLAEVETGESADQIGAALEQADEVIGIFDAFLRIARLEAGTTKAEFKPVAMADIAGDVVCAYGPVIEDAGRRLDTDIASGERIVGDRVLLIQMLANMIENALRHTPEDSNLRLVARDGALGLADSGPGIPEAEREKVLQPLYRLEKSRTTEGAGLGLSLVRTIADLHGARLVLSEDPVTGRGLFIRADFATDAKLTNL